MSDPRTDTFRAAMERGIAEAQHAMDEPPVQIGSWVVIYEKIEADGETCLSTCGSEDATAWKRIGMIRAHLMTEEYHWNVHKDDE